MEYKFYVKSPTMDENKYKHPQIAVEEFRYLGKIDQETVWLIGLNSNNKAILKENIFKGTIDSSTCDPKLIFKRLLVSGSTSFILIHNHPGGDSKPSREDDKVTEKIKKIAEIVGIRFLDHIIIADGNNDNEDYYYSYAASGFLG